MKKLLILVLLLSANLLAFAQNDFHDFIVKDINGKDFHFKQLKGKKVLIVNTASKCGNTPQYKDLQKLYDTYGKDDFVILGFPANNFGKQEPGSNSEIMEFCTEKYSVTFPMMGKISVNGDDIHPLYEWLTQKEKNSLEDSKVRWNFQKYLVNGDGELLGHFSPRTKPMDSDILKHLE